jgi:hypothetical protein
VSESKIAAWPRPPAEDEVRSLLERARGGDATDLAALREALDRHPEVWRAYGDLAAHARNAWIELIAGQDLALKESLYRQIEAMRAELAGPAPSPLEALLVERIVACWLQLGQADAAVARAGNMSVPQAEYARKRQDSAHRRYLTAIGALAMLRKLLGKAVGSSGRASTAGSSSPGRCEIRPARAGPEPGAFGSPKTSNDSKVGPR